MKEELGYLGSVAHDIRGNIWKLGFWMDRKRRILIASFLHLAKSMEKPSLVEPLEASTESRE
jgi:hypothetical protein